MFTFCNKNGSTNKMRSSSDSKYLLAEIIKLYLAIKASCAELQGGSFCSFKENLTPRAFNYQKSNLKTSVRFWEIQTIYVTPHFIRSPLELEGYLTVNK